MHFYSLHQRRQDSANPSVPAYRIGNLLKPSDVRHTIMANRSAEEFLDQPVMDRTFSFR
jgi:hypothetical protein